MGRVHGLANELAPICKACATFAHGCNLEAAMLNGSIDLAAIAQALIGAPDDGALDELTQRHRATANWDRSHFARGKSS